MFLKKASVYELTQKKKIQDAPKQPTLPAPDAQHAPYSSPQNPPHTDSYTPAAASVPSIDPMDACEITVFFEHWDELRLASKIIVFRLAPLFKDIIEFNQLCQLAADPDRIWARISEEAVWQPGGFARILEALERSNLRRISVHMQVRRNIFFFCFFLRYVADAPFVLLKGEVERSTELRHRQSSSIHHHHTDIECKSSICPRRFQQFRWSIPTKPCGSGE